MMDQPKPQASVPSFEVHVTWNPATGQIQFASSQMDDVLKLGMLEMAKLALAEQRTQAQVGQKPLIVPGRFAS